MNHPQIDTPYIDSSARPYFDVFLIEARQRNIKVDTKGLKILFMKIDRTDEYLVAGLCNETWGNTIIMDEVFWATYDSLSREEILFHELGHCLLKRDHCEYKNITGENISLMRAVSPEESDYQHRRKEYIDELFNESDKCKE